MPILSRAGSPATAPTPRMWCRTPACAPSAPSGAPTSTPAPGCSPSCATPPSPGCAKIDRPRWWRSTTPDLEQAHAIEAVDTATPESTLIAKSETVRLQAAIAQLPVVYREALVLREIHGLGYREIAAVTGVPIGTVMSRLARGRERVLARLAGSTP